MRTSKQSVVIIVDHSAGDRTADLKWPVILRKDQSLLDAVEAVKGCVEQAKQARPGAWLWSEVHELLAKRGYRVSPMFDVAHVS